MMRCTGLLLLVLLLNACDRPAPTVRRYQEISIQPEQKAAPVDPAPARMDMASTPVATAESKLTWTTPAGWVEQGGGQMRLATFKVGPEGAECAITVFPGDVGGLEANLKRWLGQLQVEIPDDVLAKFARSPQTFQSEGNLPCLVYDFEGLLAADRADCLLAAVVPTDGSTTFVKLAGPRTLLASEKENFLALCRSLKP